MDEKLMLKLEKALNLTRPEPEQVPYILTPEEEERIIAAHIIELKKQYAWKLLDRGANEGTVESKVASINWQESFDKVEYLQHVNYLRVKNLDQENFFAEQRAREKQAREEVVRRCDAKYFFNLMKWNSVNVFGKKLIVNEQTSPLITAICFFLSQDPRFETELGYSLKKGLLIRGVSGLGKTHVVQCVQRNELANIAIHSMIDISEKIRENGEYQLPGSPFVYLDDVGTEQSTVNYFGTQINYFKNFIEMYYLNRPNSFNRLLISTNCSFQQIEDLYGFRVRSRCKDMFNTIDVVGTDLRGK